MERADFSYPAVYLLPAWTYSIGIYLRKNDACDDDFLYPKILCKSQILIKFLILNT